ncbi:MAG: hypothetical protein M3Z65_02395 [Chloroflexota bacterium]|nr:hypothetical protein [Chloroflexota bacterium]
MSWRAARTLAWGALGLDVLVMIGAAVIDRDLVGPVDLVTSLPNVFFASIVSFGLLGALIITRQPANRYGWLMSAIAFIHALGYGAAAAGADLLYRDPAPRPGGVGLAWFFVWSATLHYAPSVTLVFLLFPNGRLPSPRWRPLAVLTAIAFVVAPVGVATLDGPLPVFDGVLNPFGVPGPLPLALVGSATILAAICAVGSITSLFVRYRGARGVERQQLKWILYGGATSVVAIGVILGLGIPLTAATTVITGASVVLAAAAGVAILRYHLYDIDLLINRTLVYGLTTAGLGAAFFAGIVILQTVLRPITGGSEIAVAAATLGSVALGGPLRRRAQAGVDRRFYRSRFDAARTVDDFSARLRDQVDLDALRADLLHTAADTMQPAHAGVWLRERTW